MRRQRSKHRGDISRSKHSTVFSISRQIATLFAYSSSFDTDRIDCIASIMTTQGITHPVTPPQASSAVTDARIAFSETQVYDLALSCKAEQLPGSGSHTHVLAHTSSILVSSIRCASLQTLKRVLCGRVEMYRCCTKRQAVPSGTSSARYSASTGCFVQRSQLR